MAADVTATLGRRGVTLGLLGDEAGAGASAQLAATRALGWNRLELRTIDGRQLRDIELDELRRLRERADAAGVEIAALASQIGGWSRSAVTPHSLDRDELLALAPRARVLRTRLVRIMSYESGGVDEREWRRRALRRIAELTALAEQLDLVLVHENCSGWAAQGSAQTLELLSVVDSPALRLLFDVGNPVQYGQPAVEYLREVLPWTVHVHLKDGIAEPGAGGVRWVSPGTGDAPVAECMRLLLESGYRGSWVIEPHLDLAPERGDYRAPEGALEAIVRYGRELERLAAGALAECPQLAGGGAR